MSPILQWQGRTNQSTVRKRPMRVANREATHCTPFQRSIIKTWREKWFARLTKGSEFTFPEYKCSAFLILTASILLYLFYIDPASNFLDWQRGSVNQWKAARIGDQASDWLTISVNVLAIPREQALLPLPNTRSATWKEKKPVWRTNRNWWEKWRSFVSVRWKS